MGNKDSKSTMNEHDSESQSRDTSAGGERNRLNRRLAMKDESDEFGEDENHAKEDCRYCDGEHLGELYSSPPDGFYIRYYCTVAEQRARGSFQ